jgi:hypothetical protein
VSATLVRSLARARAELRAMVAQRSAPSDPVVLAESLGFVADPWQRELLLSEARQVIMLASRQSGKSTVSALLALHTALHRAPALILLLAPSLRQSQELFRTIRGLLAALGEVSALVEQESALRLEMGNGSRILSLPGKQTTVRGFSGASLVVIDEASQVADDLYQAIRPMVAVSRGRIVLLSTPFGRRGFFHQEWAEGGPDWHRFKIVAADVPRIPADWLEQERARIGDFWYRQEYGCEFVDELTAVFPSALIEQAMDASVLPLFDPPPSTEGGRYVGVA